MILPGIIKAENAGLTTTNNEQGYGTVTTASSLANTKGSWTELIASTTSDCCFLEFDYVMESLGGVRSAALDIGVGAAASETVMIADLFTSPNFNGLGRIRVGLPMQVPAGSRISARLQTSASGSKTAAVNIIVHNGWFPLEIIGVDAINFTSGSTTGTTISPSSTVGAKGSYSQLIASSARDYFGLFASFGIPDGQRSQWKIDIAIGAAASEVIIIPDRYVYYGDSTNGIGTPTDALLMPFLPIHIPAGSRIAARLSSTTSYGTPIVLYGVF